MSSNKFEPMIVTFTCRWCTYQAADTAGTSRMEYPSNLIPVKVQCSGRIDPCFVLKAFREGADGVFIGGCHPGECHYNEGNYKTAVRIRLLHHLIKKLGIDSTRLRLEWIAAAEPDKFTRCAKEFVEQIRELGPLKLKELANDNYKTL